MTGYGRQQLRSREKLMTERKFKACAHDRVCPECGFRMKKVDSAREAKFTFVWFECSRSQCDGQWLEKLPNI
jgi:rubredoxin